MKFLKDLLNWLVPFNGGYALCCLLLILNGVERPFVVNLLLYIFFNLVMVLFILFLILALVASFKKPNEKAKDKIITTNFSKTFKDSEVTISKYAKYDEYGDRDYMVYEVKYKNGYKEFVSREVYNMLEELYENTNK